MCDLVSVEIGELWISKILVLLLLGRKKKSIKRVHVISSLLVEGKSLFHYEN